MILLCAACNARYLVPATVFANGPRYVRCARCGNTWQESLPPEPPAPLPPPPLPKPEISVPESFDAALKEAEGQSKETKKEQQAITTSGQTQKPQEFAEPPETTPPIPEGSGLPVVWNNSLWRKIAPFVAIATTVMLVLTLAISIVLFVSARDRVVKKWPALERFYYAIGLEIEHPGDGLILQNVRSERKFEDSFTQLVVSGEIRNASSKTRILPAIRATAMGADGSIIQGWQIDAPTVKLSSEAIVPFKSSIKAPESAVVEVTLSFVEMDKDGNKPSH